MKKKIIAFTLIIGSISIIMSCNSQEKKEEKKLDNSQVNRDTSEISTNTVTEPRSQNDGPNPAVNIYLISLTPEFDIEGRDGKDWNTQITFNVIFEGQNLANFEGETCCSGGRQGSSPNPTDWNSGDHIPRGIKTLPQYILNRNDITKQMLSNSYAYFGWRPVGRDGSDGIRWTLTATFSDNSRIVYSRPETFANNSGFQTKQSLLRDNNK